MANNFLRREDVLQITAGSVASLLGVGYLYLKSKSDDIPRDLRFIYRMATGKYHVSKVATRVGWNITDFFREVVQRAPDKKSLVFIEDDGSVVSYTYKQVDEISDQVANWAYQEGVREGDKVALMMDNRPEFIITWLGIAKLNATTALINTNLKGRPLMHSLAISSATRFIIGSEHTAEVREVQKLVQTDPSAPSNLRGAKWFSYGANVDSFVHLDPLVRQMPTKMTVKSPASRKAADALFYIYTSGTTGLPKASIIRHYRMYFSGMAFAEGFEVNSDDIIYNTLPLYHSSGGMMGVSMAWYRNCTIVFRRKFSARRFWDDCKSQNCTIIQYIGELCRYLLSQPSTPAEKEHKVRLAIGNGLRPDVWQKFHDRFNIGIIGEFYGSTEGNANLANIVGRENAVGFVPPLVSRFFPLELVKYDVATDQILRGKNGLCILCGPGEVGELLGKIEDDDPTRHFSGYTDNKASEKKILHDVVEKGDKYFRTGDLLKKDIKGYYFFVDRIGDSFRWKGENVSTGEVEAVINTVPGVLEVNVYGVHLPGHEGRCGMACIVKDKSKFDLDILYDITMKELPGYAAPLFLRLGEEMDITGTFKHKKTDLVKEGFDINVIKDPVFMRDDKHKRFTPVTPEIFAQLSNSQSSKL